ncbi:uncharacterized protein LOC113337153 isoform X2 [Papaver somniferum]|uniref:uncharacterized protein LOC113337153 isoform X2 n=1 Tax=Papaver somniferum TaxID=3469 RepID=UPI000E7010AC|nr:uncharacterized protein LOC113337153 isoform X2 [Papaver somniferum]
MMYVFGVKGLVIYHGVTYLSPLQRVVGFCAAIVVIKMYTVTPPEASSSRYLVNFGKNYETGIPHRNTLVSLKALGEEDTKLMDSGERARSSGGAENSYLSKGAEGRNQSLDKYKLLHLRKPE